MRTLRQIIASVPTSDGAGVKLRRSVGNRHGAQLDPFLMLDEFYSDDPNDYLAGFPSHPHRGFETVTYMLDGHMRHEDQLGNRGDLGPGDVQWMSAARGIIHSEMPQQTAGRMRGFQLWINLPAREKMKPAAYRDIPAREIPDIELTGAARVKIIAGRVQLEGRSDSGPVNQTAGSMSTDPLYLDIILPPDSQIAVPIPAEHSAFLYLYDGEAQVGPPGSSQQLPTHSAGVLSDGQGDDQSVRIRASNTGARLLLLAARPLKEPVVQYGPFVMNTRQEIEQAVDDFRSGRFAAG
jgi:redox-sensitive bicupin YhaK (pirin superfamily)